MFGGLKIYAVYVKPGAAHGGDRPVLVKEGFNIFAFLFSLFWALYHRLWLPVLYILLFNAALVWATNQQLLSEPSLAAIQLAFQAWLGFQANDWRQAKLRRKGYILADVAVADSLYRAEQRYFERMLAASPG